MDWLRCSIASALVAGGFGCLMASTQPGLVFAGMVLTFLFAAVVLD